MKTYYKTIDDPTPSRTCNARLDIIQYFHGREQLLSFFCDYPDDGHHGHRYRSNLNAEIQFMILWSDKDCWKKENKPAPHAGEGG